MVCVPCYAIPILLFLWKFIEPFISMFWKPKEQIKATEEDNSKAPLITGDGDGSGVASSNNTDKKTD